MKSVDGRPWANRKELIEHSGFSRAALANLWRDRDSNGHPPARTFDGVMHWDLEEWTHWFGEVSQRPRDLSRVDRTGDPDEELPPAGQARVLGVDPSRITQYGKKPPPGWPDPIRTEQLSQRTREYRTRAQLWEWVDDPASGFGTKGGQPTGRTEKGAAPDPRVRLAVDALAAMPDRKAVEVAEILAERHGKSVNTWRQIITQARKEARR